MKLFLTAITAYTVLCWTADNVTAGVHLVAVTLCALALLGMLAGIGEKPADTTPRSVHDRWSGRCYTCGHPVATEESVSLVQHGKPPKHFCPLCRPTFA